MNVLKEAVQCGVDDTLEFAFRRQFHPQSLDPEQLAELKATLVTELSEEDYYLILSSKSVRMGLAQQRYAKSHRIFANSRGVKDFRRFRNSQDGTCFSRSVLGA